MYRALLLVCGIYYLATGVLTSFTSSVWLLNTLTVDIHPGNTQMLAFATGFSGLLILACSSIKETRSQVFVCITLIVGHLWNLSAHIYNYIEGYEDNLAVATLMNLLVVVAAFVVITRVQRPELRDRSSSD